MQTVAANNSEIRDEILAEIAEHEIKIAELRKLLPSPIKRLFRFRCKPEQYVFVYASTRAIADQRLNERMNGTYGEAWKLNSKVVDIFDSPIQAAANSSGNLFRCLTEAEGIELLNDWREDQKGREVKSKIPGLSKSQFEQDAEIFEKQQKQKLL